MLPADRCPELETLFLGLDQDDPTVTAHAAGCPACALLLEEHRQLEKDLFRLQDPLPPVSFTAQVMAKVEAAPVPVVQEVKTGLAILAFALALCAALLAAEGASLADAGTAMARAILALRLSALAAANGVEALWSGAALPSLAACAVLLALSLLGLRRLASAPQSA